MMEGVQTILLIAAGLGTFFGVYTWTLARKISSLQTGMAVKDVEVNTLKQGQTDTKKEVNQELENIKKALTIEQAQSKQYREDSEREQGLLKNEITNLRRQLHEVEEARKTAEMANSERIKELERQIEELRQKLEAAQAKAEHEKNRADRLESEKSSLQHQLDIANAELRGRKEEGARVIEVKLIVDKPAFVLEPVPISPTQDENSPPVVEAAGVIETKEESKET